jgi:hypothetical protein
MPGRDKKRGKGKGENNNGNSSSKASLQSAVELPNLDRPASSSSLTCSTTDLTPLGASLGNLALDSADALPPPAMTNSAYDSTQSPNDASADLHSKRHVETPRYSKTNAISSFHNAFSSSKMLQQMLGLKAPEPYVQPPPMPEDLEQRFRAGLQQYGMNVQMPIGSPVEMLRRASETEKMTAGTTSGKTVLQTIEEEELSPTKATDMRAGASDAPLDQKVNLPAGDSGYEAIAGPEHTSADIERNIEASAYDNNNSSDEEDAANPANRLLTSYHGEGASETDFEDDYYTNDPYAGFGSDTTLDESQSSRPGSSFGVLDTTHAMPHALSPYNNYGTNHGSAGAGYKPPPRSSSLANLTQHLALQNEEHLSKPAYKVEHIESPSSYNANQYASPDQKVLFPSPKVGQEQSWDAMQSRSGSASQQSLASNEFAPQDADTGAPVPKITVEAPSSMKIPASKKRSATSQGAPPTKVQLDDSTVGLPTLAANQEMLWKVEFPGYTYALLTVMLSWSLTMQRLYKQFWDPFLFSINPAFPHPIGAPLCQKLVSVAFYDNSTTPHKEIRFIGAGDVAEMSYNEVDVFAYPSENASVPTGHRVSALKRTVGLDKKIRDDTGQGRWAYILLQDHRSKSPTTTPAHVMIAWPKSAMTDSSECIHTVYPDAGVAARPRFHKAVKKSTSMQNLAATLGFSKNLRATASMADLPEVGEEEGEGAWTLMRQVVKLEKAGRVPLIEGYRVDVKSWEGFLNAAGVGKGKVIMWRERE